MPGTISMTMTTMMRRGRSTQIIDRSLCPIMRRRCLHSTTPPSMATAVDTLIVGGGPIGSSTAYHLALQQQQQQEEKSIWVVERDPTYRSASATVSASGIRQQFSLKENVEMSAYGRDFLRESGSLLQVHGGDNVPDVHFFEHGYLFLASSEEDVEQLQHNHEVQKSANCHIDIDMLSHDQLAVEFPWLNTEDLRLGSFGRSGEGWFDPWALLMAFKEKNVHDLNVTYKHATPINAQRDPETGAIEKVELLDLKTQQSEWIQVGTVVNAAGAYACELLDTLAGSLETPFPVRPRKRSMFFFHCSGDQDEIVPRIAPLTVDPLTGVYVRTEGLPGAGTFVCGVSPPADQDVDCWNPAQDLQHADHALFDDIIWPALFHRVPAFGSIKVLSSWAGLYEYNTFDQNCILDYHPELPNLLLINGFSGHGLQHGPAAGRAAAELVSTGNFQTLDLAAFGYDRLLHGQQVMEQRIV